MSRDVLRPTKANAGRTDRQDLADGMLAAGFDAPDYLDRHPDVRKAGMDEAGGLRHFLLYGYAEGRVARFGPLYDSLAAVAALPIPDRTYHVTLFRSVLAAQWRHPDTEEQFWKGWDDALIKLISAMGGIPYVVIGDSHAPTYMPQATWDRGWLAGLPLICRAGRAAWLHQTQPATGHGPRILQWASVVAASNGVSNTPILLKFGGQDAEVGWLLRRLRHNDARFSLGRYDDHARDVAASYGAFLRALSRSLPGADLRICSVYPPALVEPVTVSRFLTDLLKDRRDRAESIDRLDRLDIPGFHDRVVLRRLFNAHLQALADMLELPFIDDFTPLLNEQGVTDARYLPPQTGSDNHLQDHSLHEPITALLQRQLAR